MAGKSTSVQSGRRDDDTQVRATGKEPFQIAQQKIDIQRTLMRFIDNDRVILIQEAIALSFGEQILDPSSP